MGEICPMGIAVNHSVTLLREIASMYEKLSSLNLLVC